jgi:hypothetical protein
MAAKPLKGGEMTRKSDPVDQSKEKPQFISTSSNSPLWDKNNGDTSFTR